MNQTLSDAAALRWQIEAGVDETIGEMPLDRFAAPRGPAAAPETILPEAIAAGPAADRPRDHGAAASPPRPPAAADAVLHDAWTLAKNAGSLEELAQVVAGFDGCGLKKTATNLVFGDGNADARVVFIGEAPGAEEDRRGLPFVGPSGQLLNAMLASIGLGRGDVFISNTVFWRPPGNRTPTTAETALCMPFVERMMELIDPDILVTLGGPAAKAMLAQTAAVGRLRGRWLTYATPRLSRPVAATALYHPAYLLRSPQHKREAWADLLAIRDKLAQLPG